MTTQDIVETWKSELYETWSREHLQEGLALSAHLLERRLGRRLTTDERALLVQRLGSLGPDRLGDVVLDLPPDALAAWLADPNAK